MEYEVIYRIFSGSPIIKTPRLILRNMAVSDASDMFEYAKRSDVTEFLSWYPHENEEYTREYLKYIQSFYKAGNFYDLAIEIRDTGKMIGTCGFTRFDCKNNSAEIGYVLNPSFWHNGYATEAISAILKFGFEELKLMRIEARFITGNQASRRAMERAGMKYEGTHRNSMLIKGRYRSIGICALLREEYEPI